jgi:hypothetical protein
VKQASGTEKNKTRRREASRIHTLVWPERAIELHTEASVHLLLPCVVDPSDSELDRPLRLHYASQDREELGPLRDDRLQRGQNLLHSLKKLRLIGIPGDHGFVEGLRSSQV